MLPYKSIIQIDRASNAPIYLQISNEFIKRILDGTIPAGMKLPGARTLSNLLAVNRRTVSVAFEELQAQGWIETIPNKGSFVHTSLPVLKAEPLAVENYDGTSCNFSIPDKFDFLDAFPSYENNPSKRIIDAGYPDLRLSPLREITQSMNALLKSNKQAKLMKYSTCFRGDTALRSELKSVLRESRSIKCELDNVCVTRGSLMAFYLIFKVLLEAGDTVVVGDVSFKVANHIIRLNGGKLIEVGIDKQGIDVEAIEAICKKQPIKAVFVMPHHHNPTTVSLSADRRMKLLLLARQYNFAIIEDDYDYDFHYNRNPLLPMASLDQSGNVIYVGSLSKTIAPGLRIGYIVAPANLVTKIANLSRFMDCHGNHALERAIALLYKDGQIKRYLKKSLRTYARRRDLFCQTLKEQLGDAVKFEIPEGGLAVWVHFQKQYPLEQIREACMENGLLIPKAAFTNSAGNRINAIRMGFASLNEEEIVEYVGILKRVLEEN